MKDNIDDLFALNWEVWSPKILSYAKASDKCGTREYTRVLAESPKVSKGMSALSNSSLQ